MRARPSALLPIRRALECAPDRPLRAAAIGGPGQPRATRATPIRGTGRPRGGRGPRTRAARRMDLTAAAATASVAKAAKPKATDRTAADTKARGRGDERGYGAGGLRRLSLPLEAQAWSATNRWVRADALQTRWADIAAGRRGRTRKDLPIAATRTSWSCCSRDDVAACACAQLVDDVDAVMPAGGDAGGVRSGACGAG